MAASVSLLSMLLRGYSYLLAGDPRWRHIRVWGEYMCTGIELGKGAYATVYLGRHSNTANPVAIKTMGMPPFFFFFIRWRARLCSIATVFMTVTALI